MNTYHFIGLGGIGMSALARVLIEKGEKVQGSDIRSSQLLSDLEKEGAHVQIGHSAESVIQDSTVIYSTDVKDDNVEIIRARELKLPMLHRSDLLDYVMKGKKPLLVTGTHGKTTTSGLLAKVLMEAGLNPSFVVGGILLGLQTNGHFGGGEYFVAEADESDGSFLKTASFGAIVTNLENDHLDYWKEPKNLNQGFAKFFSQVQKSEHLFWCADDARLSSLKPPGQSYGFSSEAQWRIEEFAQTGKGIVFNLVNGEMSYSKIEVSLFGRHNALNAAAVFALALSLGGDETLIRQGLGSFSGVMRRLEFKGEVQKVELFDDYGHHPTEIKATIGALRERVGERRLVVVFQPHRYTRVRDLFEEFFGCFDQADEVILTDIYSAGEAPIEGITSASLYTRMREKLGSKLHFLSRLNLEMGVSQMLMPHDVVLTIGAGDVTRTGETILRQLAQRAPKWRVGLVFNESSSKAARHFIEALDPSIYETQLFGVTDEGGWISGADCFEKIGHKVRLNSESLKISSQILQDLSSCQIIFPLLPKVQGLFEALKIPYAGASSSTEEACKSPCWIGYISDLTGIKRSHTGPIQFIVRGNEVLKVSSPDDLSSADLERGERAAKKIYQASLCLGAATIHLALDPEGHFRLERIETTLCSLAELKNLDAISNDLVISALHRQRWGNKC